MNLLGIDTATAASAACVVRADGAAFEVEPVPERLLERPGHAAELMPAVARCVEQAGLEWSDLDAVGVGVGPGMFTGLRIGVATARGLATALGVELRPVSSLAALAAGAGGAEAVLAAIDARRGEVFAALYGADGAVVWEPFVAAPDALVERLGGLASAPVAVGDGAVRYREALEGAGARVPEDAARAHVVRGLAICRLAEVAPAAAVEAVVPDYLREPDAKPRAAA